MKNEHKGTIKFDNADISSQRHIYYNMKYNS